MQAAAFLRGRIESGEWAPGRQLPSLEELARQFSVARVTVRQAIDELERDGLIWRRRGKGTFVTENAGRQERLSVASDWNSLLKMIDGTELEVLDQRRDAACPHEANEEAGYADAYQFLRRVHSLGGKPYALIDIYLDQNFFDRWQGEFLEAPVLTVIGAVRPFPVARAYQTMRVGTADPLAARYLKVPVGAPVAFVRRILVGADGRILYLGDVVYRGDFVTLKIDLIRTTTPET